MSGEPSLRQVAAVDSKSGGLYTNWTVQTVGKGIGNMEMSEEVTGRASCDWQMCDEVRG